MANCSPHGRAPAARSMLLLVFSRGGAALLVALFAVGLAGFTSRLQRELAGWDEQRARRQARERADGQAHDALERSVDCFRLRAPREMRLRAICAQAGIPLRLGDGPDEFRNWLAEPIPWPIFPQPLHTALADLVPTQLALTAAADYRYRIEDGALVIDAQPPAPTERTYARRVAALIPQVYERDPYGQFPAREQTAAGGAEAVRGDERDHCRWRRWERALDRLPAADPTGEPILIEPAGATYRTLVTAHHRARAALAEPITFTARNQPLDELLDRLSSALGAPLTPDAELYQRPPRISIAASQAPLRQVLSETLSDHSLELSLRSDGVLRVQPQEKAGEDYELLAAIPAPDFRLPDRSAAEPGLVSLVKTCVQPDMWDEMGGPGLLEPWPERGWLIARAPAFVLEDVVNFIAQLRAARRMTGTSVVGRELAVWRALQRPLDWRWEQKPLSDALRELQQRLGVPVTPLPNLAGEPALPLSELRVSCGATRAPLGMALAQLLLREQREGYQDLRLGYQVGDQGLVIVDANHRRLPLQATVLNVAEWPALRSRQADVEVLLRAVDHENQDEASGSHRILRHDELLVVYAPAAATFELRQLLAFLDDTARRPAPPQGALRAWRSAEWWAESQLAAPVALPGRLETAAETLGRFTRRLGWVLADGSPDPCGRQAEGSLTKRLATAVPGSADEVAWRELREQPVRSALAELLCSEQHRLALHPLGIVGPVPVDRDEQRLLHYALACRFTRRVACWAPPRARRATAASEFQTVFSAAARDGLPAAEWGFALGHDWRVLSYLPELEPLVQKFARGEPVRRIDVEKVVAELDPTAP